MSRIRLIAASAAAVLTVAAARPADAQSATIAVSADVQAPLTLNTLAPLNFTTVFPGLAKTVTPAGGANAATAGNVAIAGQANAQVNVSFTLPATLDNGGVTMPISFSATSACYNAASNSSTGCTAFNPATAIQQNLSGTGNLWIYLGGTVTPTAAQAAGTYTGSVTIDVAYTGN